MPVQPFAPGNYRFLTHAFQYSGGVAAEPGYAIERARFARPLPLAEGFDAIEAYLARLGRPPTAFCACELRSPKQFTEQGFIDFNRRYVQRLEKWGIFREEINPVARSNVCPEIDPPAEPSFYAFSYTVPGAGKSFVAAGGGERRLPMLAVEKAARLHLGRVVIVEAARIHAVVFRIGARLIEGVDAAMPAEGVFRRAGAEGVGRQIVRAAQDLQPLVQHRQV